MAQNALEVARFGGLDTGEEAAPFEVVAEQRIFKLRRYFANAVLKDAPAIILVPPMMLAAEVWDVSPHASAVRELHGHGVDAWVVDFGSPSEIEGGLERNLADHVVAVSEAVDLVRGVVGKDVHLAGYSQGGMFCYQAGAYRRGKGLSSIVTFGSPVDTRGVIPFGLPEEVIAKGAAVLGDLFGGNQLPAWASRAGFRLLDPVKAVRQQVDFVMQLHDREALLPREGQRRFLQADGFVAWPGPALADFMRQFVAHNRMLRGGFVIEDRLVTLADITCPVLTFVGEVDEIAPPASVRPIIFAAPRATIYEKSMRAGHFGLVVGSTSTRETWPVVAGWTKWREDHGKLPEDVGLAGDPAAVVPSAGMGPRVGYGVQLAAGVGAGLVRGATRGASRTVGTVRELGVEAAEQLPRLSRLEAVRPRTRTSLALMLDEGHDRSPDTVLFLFEDRAHTRAAAKHRIDSVVRGLISLGVRQGEHVGVLMDMRPSALTAVVALNRIGAVSVLLRPDGAVTREARLGQVSRIVCDPQHMEIAAQVDAQILVLGGGAQERDLGPNVVDMERIDPDTVVLPRWYRPNPGRARDLAYILFTGEGERTRINRITNGRWLLSAMGTASSASLGGADTIYSVTPVYHPSGLLVGIGGAIAGGSRIAMARHWDPTTFWDEVRRYGVTIVTYTWTMLRDLVEAPPHPGERHHPVRLFVGSGMPPALWRRTLDRFGPAGVVEFYTSSVGDAVLVNLGTKKIGAMGRRLPGSARVRIAAYDPDAGRLETGKDGFAIVCDRDEVGMLLCEADADDPAGSDSALRGVFKRDDAWLATGDLFRRDVDGDYWLVDPVGSLIHTSRGAVPSAPIRDALGRLDAVDLAVCYGVPGPGGKAVAVAAVTLREGQELTAAKVTEALSRLEPRRRPSLVRVVAELPVTTWFRPLSGQLRAEGIPTVGQDLPVWVFDEERAAYRKLTLAARKKLASSPDGSAAS
ncbi:AMP-binding protein [Paraconexibacter antarcticus]|uniref:AMP-binding protein n=2 Tax=Paraconexibacter antarcticus TaxID=2949664 RepID=A0ABY5DNE4_9ACTN|nr:AMP-binding protein [Paraconexibacter antarcticus]